jgi:hypothetical protein
METLVDLSGKVCAAAKRPGIIRKINRGLDGAADSLEGQLIDLQDRRMEALSKLGTGDTIESSIQEILEIDEEVTAVRTCMVNTELLKKELNGKTPEDYKIPAKDDNKAEE